MKHRTPLACYVAGIVFVANNDEPGETDRTAVSEMLSVVTLAEAFGVAPAAVAADVLRYRARNIIPRNFPLP